MFRAATALSIFACFFFMLRLSSAQDANPFTPTKPPAIKLGQIHVAKLRAGAEEPTVTLLGFTTKRELRTREVEKTRKVPQTRTRVVVRDGKVVEEAFVEQVPVKMRITETYTVEAPATKTSHFPAKEIQAWDLTGKRVETADLLKRLEKPRHVFVLEQPLKEGRAPIDAFYRSVLKDDVLFAYAATRATPKAVPR